MRARAFSAFSETLSRVFTNRLFVTLASATFIVIGTFIAITLAKGYRPTLDGDFKGTGLLAANSFPNGAQVYLNGRLATATDTTINLEPGEYAIEIRKDGFATWKKSLRIEKELVTQTNALLFPIAPSLSPLTYTGATNVSPSPDGQKLVLYVASASAQARNGLYVFDLSDNVLSLQRGARQVSQTAAGFDLAKAKLVWSPDTTQILVSYDGHNVLLDSSRMNNLAELQDVGYRLPRLFSEWEEELYKRERTRLAKFPEEIQHIATASAINVYFAPDDDRVMYTATATATLSENLVPPIPAASSQVQERVLQPGGIYIYDRREDRNFRVGTEDLQQYATQPQTAAKTTKKTVVQAVVTQPKHPKVSLATDLSVSKAKSLTANPLAFQVLQGATLQESATRFLQYYSSLFTHGMQWLPDSKHLLSLRGDMVVVKEYDGTNENMLYGGEITESFVYPWPNGSKVIILTRLNQAVDNPTNLYAITLR